MLGSLMKEGELEELNMMSLKMELREEKKKNKILK